MKSSQECIFFYLYINHTLYNENVKYNYEDGSGYSSRDIFKDEELLNTYQQEEMECLI